MIQNNGDKMSLFSFGMKSVTTRHFILLADWGIFSTCLVPGVALWWCAGRKGCRIDSARHAVGPPRFPPHRHSRLQSRFSILTGWAWYTRNKWLWGHMIDRI